MNIGRADHQLLGEALDDRSPKLCQSRSLACSLARNVKRGRRWPERLREFAPARRCCR